VTMPVCNTLLFQYERCCQDWRHHDAIVWEMPLAAISANAVIVWAARGVPRAGTRLGLRDCGRRVRSASLGLQKQVAYAVQINRRIREIEDELGLPRVTFQSGRAARQHHDGMDAPYGRLRQSGTRTGDRDVADSASSWRAPRLHDHEVRTSLRHAHSDGTAAEKLRQALRRIQPRPARGL